MRVIWFPPGHNNSETAWCVCVCVCVCVLVPALRLSSFSSTCVISRTYFSLHCLPRLRNAKSVKSAAGWMCVCGRARKPLTLGSQTPNSAFPFTNRRKIGKKVEDGDGQRPRGPRLLPRLPRVDARPRARAQKGKNSPGLRQTQVGATISRLRSPHVKAGGRRSGGQQGADDCFAGE